MVKGFPVLLCTMDIVLVAQLTSWTFMPTISQERMPLVSASRVIAASRLQTRPGSRHARTIASWSSSSITGMTLRSRRMSASDSASSRSLLPRCFRNGRSDSTK